MWLLKRCVAYNLRALEASLPLDGTDDAKAVGKRAADLGITWIGYWSNDFVTPAGGSQGLRDRAEQAFDVATSGGVKTVVIFGNGGRHNRFTKEPPLPDQLKRAADHLGPVAETASARGVQLGLLPHLDYRGHELTGLGDAGGQALKSENGVRHNQSVSGLRRACGGRHSCASARRRGGAQRCPGLSPQIERRDDLGNTDRRGIGRF